MVHEPPARVTLEGVEPHPHKTGHRLFDLIVAGSAILISCISLFVAVEHGHTMQKLVAANSWPLLQFGSSNYDTDRQRLSIDMAIENVGVGPAIVKHFAVNYGGKSYTNANLLLRDCCGYAPPSKDSSVLEPGMPIVGIVEGTVVAPREDRNFLRMELSEANTEAWRKLDAARFDFRYEACYCSVLDECWRSDLTGIDPRPVKQCPAPAPRQN